MTTHTYKYKILFWFYSVIIFFLVVNIFSTLSFASSDNDSLYFKNAYSGFLGVNLYSSFNEDEKNKSFYEPTFKPEAVWGISYKRLFSQSRGIEVVLNKDSKFKYFIVNDSLHLRMDEKAYDLHLFLQKRYRLFDAYPVYQYLSFGGNLKILESEKFTSFPGKMLPPEYQKDGKWFDKVYGGISIKLELALQREFQDGDLLEITTGVGTFLNYRIPIYNKKTTPVQNGYTNLIFLSGFTFFF